MRTQKFKLPKLKAGIIFMMIIIGLVFSACTEYPQYNETINDYPESETYTIGPEGGIITAQNNAVFIRIPEGAVLTETEMKIRQINSYHNESIVMMDKGVSISIGDQQLLKPIRLQLNYDLKELCLGSKDEHCLQIYAYKNMTGVVTSSDCFSPVGECCVNPNSCTVYACFDELGNFVVGVKQ